MQVAAKQDLPRTQRRADLLRAFKPRIKLNSVLTRPLVSFQANRHTPVLNWFKYKEGFSAALVEYVVSSLQREPGVLLDPFAGIGTSLFTARRMGWDGIGIEVLPVGYEVMQTYLSADRTTPSAFKRQMDPASVVNWLDYFDGQFALRHIPITRGAFPEETERAIAGYRAYCAGSIQDRSLRKLFEFAGMAVLEEVSFTRKDGQYLRWDARAGKARTKTNFNKGRICSFDDAIKARLLAMYGDLLATKQGTMGFDSGRRQGSLDLRQGTCLDVLPHMEKESIDLVLTSFPYCNRYDYTRSYALELVYLGCTADDVKRLRQALLSCTVENRAKDEALRSIYRRLGREATFNRVKDTFDSQDALHEVLAILNEFAAQKKLNNTNVPRMVRNYFLEMSFVIFEIARVLRRGGHVVLVNDNVQYAGEEIPVDIILSNVAEDFGLDVEHIWVLARGKGNSSQQMGAHGRSELRKCVYLWRKR